MSLKHKKTEEQKVKRLPQHGRGRVGFVLSMPCPTPSPALGWANAALLKDHLGAQGKAKTTIPVQGSKQWNRSHPAWPGSALSIPIALKPGHTPSCHPPKELIQPGQPGDWLAHQGRPAPRTGQDSCSLPHGQSDPRCLHSWDLADEVSTFHPIRISAPEPANLEQQESLGIPSLQRLREQNDFCHRNCPATQNREEKKAKIWDKFNITNF